MSSEAKRIGDRLRAQGHEVREYRSAAQVRHDIKTGELDGETGERVLGHFNPGEKVGEKFKKFNLKKVPRKEGEPTVRKLDGQAGVRG